MCNINIINHQNTCKLITLVNVHLNKTYVETKPSPLDHVSTGVLPAPLSKCWPRNLHGPSTKPWQPFLRLPPSPRSPRSRRPCPTHAGTSYGRCSWRRSGVPLQMFCSATRSSRAASEASQTPPSPCLGGPCGPGAFPSSLARPAPRTPPPPPFSRAQHHFNFLPCHLSPVFALPGSLSNSGLSQERCQVVNVRPPESSEALQCCSPRRETTGKHLAVSHATDCCL